MSGLRSLAVVLVRSQVEDTAERVSNPHPQAASATHSAFSVESMPRRRRQPTSALWDDWERRFSQRCSQISVLHADAEVQVVNNDFFRAIGGTDFDATAAGYAAAGDSTAPTASKARVQCEVQ